MKLGVCTSFDNLKKSADMGFEYIEVGVGSVSSLSEDDFIQLQKKLDGSPIPINAANVMLPGPFHVTGEAADHLEIKNFLTRAFPRLHAIGCQVVVFGSGGARRLPEGFPMEKAQQQLKDACHMIADIAYQNDLTIALEPLNRNETNIINSIPEGGELVSEVAHPSFRLLADFYHMSMEHEPFEVVLPYGTNLCHVHIAAPVTRAVPSPDDGTDYDGFFRVLKSTGYQGRVSFEGRVEDFDRQLPEMVSFLRPLMK